MLAIKGKLFDGEKVDEGVVLIEGGKIIKVGKDIDTSDVKVIEGDFITPGLIDAHVHFFGVSNDNVLEWNITSEGLSTARSVSDMIRLLSAGFTTVRDLGSKSAVYLSKAEKEGTIIGPRVIASGYSIAETGGNDDPKDLPLDMAQRLSYSFYCDSPWECRKAVRLAIRQGAGVIKVYASGAFSQGGKVKVALTIDDLKAIVDEAHKAGLKVASHAYGEEAIANSIEAGVDTIEHGLGLTESLAKEIKRKGICYIPTLATYDVNPKISKLDEEIREKREELIRRHFTDDMTIAVEHELKIAAGTDYVGSAERPHGMNYKEIVLLSKYMSLEKALSSATSIAGECLGINAGKLKEGYVADIAIFGKVNSAEDLNPFNVKYTVRKGRLYDSKVLRDLFWDTIKR
ncbi:metal-dependent hydrolase family protein [Acidianus ambivalens]|uniref:Amidohydrolase family protein n=1 Tax=Acidianus ambivalens TaxID=2283 RepID=A0A650CWG7_ACIAM|nr:amidohydrolase family protein [Acidianus ambivalens]MQL54345.1 amidohydrolase family protein [Acidianus ambivalens]QGR22170.1 amidohydrolase family protein [Acidianus ambivalens]